MERGGWLRIGDVLLLPLAVYLAVVFTIDFFVEYQCPDCVLRRAAFETKRGYWFYWSGLFGVLYGSILAGVVLMVRQNKWRLVMWLLPLLVLLWRWIIF